MADAPSTNAFTSPGNEHRSISFTTRRAYLIPARHTRKFHSRPSPRAPLPKTYPTRIGSPEKVAGWWDRSLRVVIRITPTGKSVSLTTRDSTRPLSVFNRNCLFSFRCLKNAYGISLHGGLGDGRLGPVKASFLLSLQGGGAEVEYYVSLIIEASKSTNVIFDHSFSAEAKVRIYSLQRVLVKEGHKDSCTALCGTSSSSSSVLKCDLIFRPEVNYDVPAFTSISRRFVKGS
ncbi:hypothetical protein EDD18DRAFT_1329766 [Armillaria luteobubalina]|uniref:Uncharacterized protein n=1 Tax=Armillaria luteobubalina TaxID=153913 RepID=A0AA39QB19_9AGAR|nr:hypothetical protein EDD18DRAFT_1329766 [Armillaria luteobubalina]